MNRYLHRVQELEGEVVGSATGFIHLSESMLEEIELLIANPLPPDYREFLQDFGGISFLRGATFDADGISGGVDMFYGVNPLNVSEGLVSEYFMWCNSFVRWPVELIPGIKLLRSVEESETELSWPRELLPIGMDAGDNQICLSLMGLNPGAVFFWNNAPSLGEQNVYLIAKSFGKFLDSLYLRG